MKTGFIRIIAIVVAVLACHSMPVKAETDTGLVFRVWTSSKGSSVTAIFVQEEDGMVQLRNADGKKLSIKRTDLSKEDLKYLDGQQSAAPAAAEKPLPEEPKAAEAEVADPVPGQGGQGAWLISQATIVTNYEGHDISSAYTQRFENAYCSRTAPQGHRLVLVKCSIKARTADADAIDKLNTIRTPMAEKLELIGKSLLVSDSDKRELIGGYRLVNAADVAIVTSPGNRCQAAWVILPPDRCGIFFFETGSDKPVLGGVRAKPPWHHTCTTRNGFSGLLEVGKPAQVTFLFCVPRSLDLHTVKLEIEGQGGLPL